MTITVETKKGILNAFRDENKAIDAMLASKDMYIASQGAEKLERLRSQANNFRDRWNYNYQRADCQIAFVRDTTKQKP